MNTPDQDNTATEQRPNDKELNFRMLEQKYERQLAQERQARLEAEKAALEARQRPVIIDEDDDNSEPYVDHKRLKREQEKVAQKIKSEVQTDMQRAIAQARAEAAQEAWLDANPDFYSILQNNAEKLMQRSPAMAKSILNMPDNFERQKLVYQTIKELGLDKPQQAQSTIQDKVDANRRHPVQPGGVATGPYAGQQADFSTKGQQDGYAKMQELKNRMRL